MIPSFEWEWIRSLLPLGLLYPELHYAFRYLPFSRYRIREPEIITDAPFRIAPDRSLPVLLLVKDADRFPIFLDRLEVKLEAPGYSETRSFAVSTIIGDSWWHRTFEIELSPDLKGQTVHCLPIVFYRVGTEPKTAEADNLPHTSHRAFQIFCAKESFPGSAGWIHGDLHTHSSYTSDQIEFGAPPEAMLQVAASIGLDFFAITDHSYDLDDEEHNYLRNSPSLRKWKRFQEEVRSLNKSAKDVTIIPGEEVSCANAEGRNVHLLIFNDSGYFPGSGDSAEKWFHTDAELTIEDALVLSSNTSLVVAAHPMDEPPALERFFLKRGSWTDEDWRYPPLRHYQVLNGVDNKSFHRGLRRWIAGLLEGQRIFIAAGSDAHGNFNRYRQIDKPFWRIGEKENFQQFGRMRSTVFLPGKRSVALLIDALKRGHLVIGNGPFATVSIVDRTGSEYIVGQTCKGPVDRVMINALSSQEFGWLEKVRIFKGHLGGKEELWFDASPNAECFSKTMGPLGGSGEGYLRCEALTSKGCFCYSNPVWFVTAR